MYVKIDSQRLYFKQIIYFDTHIASFCQPRGFRASAPIKEQSVIEFDADCLSSSQFLRDDRISSFALFTQKQKPTLTKSQSKFLLLPCSRVKFLFLSVRNDMSIFVLRSETTKILFLSLDLCPINVDHRHIWSKSKQIRDRKRNCILNVCTNIFSLNPTKLLDQSFQEAKTWEE